MSLANLAKVLKCAGSDDIVTLKANDDGDTVTFMFESPSASSGFGLLAALCPAARRRGACADSPSVHSLLMPNLLSRAACASQEGAPCNLPPHPQPQPTPARPSPNLPEEDRVSDFELKLMDIDSEHLGIPDTDYCATVTMPAGEYARICKDLSSIGDTGARG
jgi:hypothetical protein